MSWGCLKSFDVRVRGALAGEWQSQKCWWVFRPERAPIFLKTSERACFFSRWQHSKLIKRTTLSFLISTFHVRPRPIEHAQRVNHVEAAPAFDNPFMSSASEAGVGAARLERAAAAGDAGAAAAGAAAARLRGAGASRGSSAASSMGMPPFNEFTTPPSPSVAPSTFSYPATPNFSEGGTSAVDPELLERLERLEMALAEEKKARAHVEQRLQKIKEEEEEEKKSSAGVSGTAKSGKAGVQRLGTTAVAAQRGGGKVSSALAPGTTAPRAASKPSARAASSVVKRGSFR